MDNAGTKFNAANNSEPITEAPVEGEKKQVPEIIKLTPVQINNILGVVDSDLGHSVFTDIT